MDFASTVSNNLDQNLLGNVKKAIILIDDQRDDGGPDREEAVARTSSRGILGVSVPGGNPLGQLPGVGSSAVTGAKKSFTVQFNPSELRLSGYGGGMVQQMNYGGDNPNELRYEAAQPRIVLDVNLIFDRVNPKDAFMYDKVTLSETAVATGVAQSIGKKAGGMNYSVQPEIEGFIAAISNDKTRGITFIWGSLQYTGVLNHISSSYTMFNMDGQPVRGNVRLSLVTADGGDTGLGQWKKAFERAFSGDGANLTAFGQRVGSVLNLNG